MASKSVTRISECFIKPQHWPEKSTQPFHLTTWDLSMISVQYIQKGLFFIKPSQPQPDFINTLLDKLQYSLSLVLVHYYPLAGRLVTKTEHHPSLPSSAIFIDCSGSPGAKFIHSSLDMSVSDIVSTTYVPTVVQSLFDHDRAVNHDGHFRPLLSIQVTELVDGIFIGCSMNHAVGDGSSFWEFFNSWSEVFRANENGIPDVDCVVISRPPVMERWFPDGIVPPLRLPYADPDEFISRFESPILKERIFHFTSGSIAGIKSRANSEAGTKEISSFQSLSAFVWRSMIKARRHPPEQLTNCRLAMNNRSRLDPPLEPYYFGNSIQTVKASTTAGELLSETLGWAAWRVHEAVVGHTDQQVKDLVNKWLKLPFVYQMAQLFDPFSVMMGSSPRFNKYGCEFGLGKAVALRSGYAHKFDGKVSCYPGRNGGGSVDLEICLPAETMTALESDDEFMAAIQ